MKKKIAIIILALLITTGLGFVSYYYITTPRGEGVCKLKTVSSVPYLYEYDIVHYYRTSDKKPESLLDFPDNIDGRKLFFTIPFKHRGLNGCLIDHGQKRYTVYVDLNGNNSLADEKPLISRKKHYNRFKDSIYLFGPTMLKPDNAVTAAPFYMFLTNFTGEIHIAPTTIKKGKIRLDGAVHKVMLSDLDFDGEYKTYFSPEKLTPGGFGRQALCDKLLFDIDRDGKFRSSYFVRVENGPLAKLININKQYYSIQISKKELLASPVSPEFGTVTFNTHESSMYLYSDTYSCMINSTNTVKLPPGNYSVIYSQNLIKDSNGDIWSCQSKRSTGTAVDFDVFATRETAVDFPTSFLLKTTVDRNKDKFEIGIALFSENNKEYLPLLHKSGTTLVKPVVELFDEDNTSLHVGTMEYG